MYAFQYPSVRVNERINSPMKIPDKQADPARSTHEYVARYG
ncbi:MAG: hypothetical protein JWQ76_5855 [Ramlibacter sp.]|nr:hypothetical protein [Ramlibacter sp.]